MKDKILCLTWPPHDRIINFEKATNGMRIEIRNTKRDSTYVIISQAQIKQLKSWMLENDL